MKKNRKWKIVLAMGICPFILPFIVGLYRVSIESWTMLDWLIMYSFIYWPTYLIGFVLIVIAMNGLLKEKTDE
ncbi:MAG: hypothetical protein IJZ23_01290 [Roseburia sp.]|nr:hypothetical protein [Roseburia sp.]